MNSTLKIAVGSILVGVVVFGLKYLAFVMTGSVALYSDALESIVNVAAAAAAAVAIRVAQLPPDEAHPYGRTKAEYFSAGLEGALIILASVAIIHEAIGKLGAPHPLDWASPGLAVNVAASVLNAVWGALLVRQGRKLSSPALSADGRHLLADVYMSAGVVAAVVVAAVSGWYILDPLIAMAVAIHIIWAGWKLMRQSASGLMDAAPDAGTMAAIRETITENAAGAIEFHDLKARAAGRAVFIDFHLVVSGDLSVEKAHAICDRIEEALRAKLGEAVVSIHVEPEHEGDQHGAIVLGHHEPPSRPERPS